MSRALLLIGDFIPCTADDRYGDLTESKVDRKSRRGRGQISGIQTRHCKESNASIIQRDASVSYVDDSPKMVNEFLSYSKESDNPIKLSVFL